MTARRPVLAVLRPAHRMEDAVRAARDHGFDPLPAPMLEAVELDDAPFRGLLERVSEGRVAFLVFTSEHGVETAFAKAARAGIDLTRMTSGHRVAAVGPVTAEALRAHGVAALVPDVHDSSGLVRLLKTAGAGAGGRSVALVRSDRGSDELPEGLAAAGATVEDVPVYSLTRPRDPGPGREIVRRAAEGGVDAFAFTSSLTVRHFLDAANKAGALAAVRTGLDAAVVGAMGRPTADTLAGHGVRCDVVPDEARFEVLLALLRRHVRPVNTS